MINYRVIKLPFNYCIAIENKIIWLYKGIKTCKSISWNYCPLWDKPIYSISNNGARKGVKEDSCFDLNIHFWKFKFSYTNWNYNSRLRNAA